MPTTNPADLPNYEHEDYRYLAPALRRLLDCYEGLYGRKSEYLPKAGVEPEKAYESRLERSVFNNKLRPIVDANAGLLTAFDVAGMPPSLAAAEDDVDNHGSDLKSFCYNANRMGLRDGSCYVLTQQEPLPEGRTRTRADDIANPRRPYWKLLDRRNVLNWRVEYVAGAPVLQMVVLQMSEQVPDGAFGLKSEPRYHVLSLVEGGVQTQVYAIGEKGELIEVEPPSLAPIPRIPLVAYPDPAKPFSRHLPEFAKLSDLNIKLFREESTLGNIQYRVNAPTFWRRSRLPVQPMEGEAGRPVFVAGENYVIELMSADDIHGPDEVGVLEISGEGIAALQQSVNETKADIESESLGFISGARVERTATETYLSSAQITAGLNGKARQMSAALRRMVEDWCMFTGEDASSFEVSMDQSLLEMPLDAQEMQQLLGLWQATAIDHRTLLELLRMGRQLPPSADIDEIIRRVEAEFKQQTTPKPLPNGILNDTEEDDL